MHNEVTKWCSCSLALHPDSSQRWKFEDTTNPKNHSTTMRKYSPSGATSHPEVRHTGLPSPRSQTNGRLHDRRQRRCGQMPWEQSVHQPERRHPLISSPPFLLPRRQDPSLRSQSERQRAPCISVNNSRQLSRSLHQHQLTVYNSCGHAVHCP